MLFEWDEAKNKGNIKKHGVSFEEAATVFTDQRGIDIEDPKHSTSMEIRTIRLGKSRLSRVLIVVNTMKLKVDTTSVIRIISARRSNRKERKIYEDSDI